MNVAIANNLSHCAYCRAAIHDKQTTVAAAIVPMADEQIFFRKAIVSALKSPDGTVNAANIKIGPGGDLDEQPYELQPGDLFTIEAPVGAKYNLQDWYFFVNTDDDGLVITYS